MKFYLLNVFTKENKAGNQLAAIFPTQELAPEQMQSIAREFNFSETIFITGSSIRIFTPGCELLFAGHPTVGAAWLLNHLGLGAGNFSLQVPLGTIEASATAESASIKFPGNAIVRPFNGNLREVLHHSNVKEGDAEMRLVRNVNVGPEFTVIPVKSREALTNARSPLLSPEKVKAYFIFCENQSTFHVRMFAPGLSVAEDAATGSAACALAGYLSDVAKESEGNVTIFQGKEMGRDCKILLSWTNNEIRVGGKVKLWGEGVLS